MRISFLIRLAILTTGLLALASCGQTVVGGEGYCPGDQTACGIGCYDLESSRQHCGACDNACATSEVCTDGACVSTCAADQVFCDGRCVDPSSDPYHCGGCAGGGSGGADGGVSGGGVRCGDDEACVDGVCAIDCPPGSGQFICDGRCVDPLTDRVYCGAADDCTGGTMCGAGEICVDGACALSCPDGQVICGDRCVSTDIDPRNCGACDNVCPHGTNAEPACVDGACALDCEEGWGDCDTDPSNGCETDLNSDVDHCSACDAACPFGPASTPTCDTGVCGLTCDADYGDCDMDPSTGCEADLMTDDAHCGMCGNMCSTPGTCSAGSCNPTCYSGDARVLVYGPGGTVASTDFPAGTMVTVADEAMWRSMTTADFEAYDVIWLGGASCSGTLDSVLTAADDTVGTWGPAVQGRVVLMAGDPDLHGGAAAATFFQNSINWLKENGRTSDGGRTGLFISWGCLMCCSSTYSPGAVGTPERFSSVLGSPIAGDSINYCSAVTTTVGSSHPVLAGITSYWSCPAHGAFSTLPADYDVLAEGVAGGMAVIAARDTAVPCVTP